jgi:hypothetical protein
MTAQIKHVLSQTNIQELRETLQNMKGYDENMKCLLQTLEDLMEEAEGLVP